jgi:hypothetical protein
MNTIVCIKQILDPEIPARDFRVDGAKREADAPRTGTHADKIKEK